MIYESVATPEGTTTILRAVVGSTVHGTSIQGTDDRDEMAIAIEPPAYVLGLKHWETTVQRSKPDGVKSGPGDLDLVIHSLRKYCALTAKGNPTMQLPLWVPEKDIVSIELMGWNLLKGRHMFLSRLCGKSFLGYMQAQKARLAGEAGGRHGSRPDLVAKYGFDTKYAGHIIRLGYQGLEIMTTGQLTLPMRDEERQEVLDVREGRWSLERTLTRAGELERDLRHSLDTGPLPDLPDYDGINKMMEYSYLTVWRQMRLTD